MYRCALPAVIENNIMGSTPQMYFNLCLIIERPIVTTIIQIRSLEILFSSRISHILKDWYHCKNMNYILVIKSFGNVQYVSLVFKNLCLFLVTVNLSFSPPPLHCIYDDARVE